MAAPSKKTLLILDTGSPFCSLAADRFNSIAGMMGLPWEAVAKSIGLVGVENLQAAGRALALSQASDQPVPSSPRRSSDVRAAFASSGVPAGVS